MKKKAKAKLKVKAHRPAPKPRLSKLQKFILTWMLRSEQKQAQGWRRVQIKRGRIAAAFWGDKVFSYCREWHAGNPAYRSHVKWPCVGGQYTVSMSRAFKRLKERGFVSGWGNRLELTEPGREKAQGINNKKRKNL